MPDDWLRTAAAPGRVTCQGVRLHICSPGKESPCDAAAGQGKLLQGVFHAEYGCRAPKATDAGAVTHDVSAVPCDVDAGTAAVPAAQPDGQRTACSLGLGRGPALLERERLFVQTRPPPVGAGWSPEHCGGTTVGAPADPVEAAVECGHETGSVDRHDADPSAQQGPDLGARRERP